MIRELTDMAPPPEDTLTFVRLRGGGWLLLFDGQSEVAFSSARDMIDWLDTHVAPLEVPTADAIQMPTVLEAARPETPRNLWRIFSGGKA